MHHINPHDQEVIELKGLGTVLAHHAERALSIPHPTLSFPNLQLLIAGQDNQVSQVIENAAIAMDLMGYGGYDGIILNQDQPDRSYNVRACFSLDLKPGSCSDRSLNENRYRYGALHRSLQRLYEKDGMNGGAHVALICLNEYTLNRLIREKNFRNLWVNQYLLDEKLNGKLLFFVTDVLNFDYKKSRLSQLLCNEHPAIADLIAGGINIPPNGTTNQICSALIEQMIPMINTKSFGYETAPLLDSMAAEVTHHIASFLPPADLHQLAVTNNWFSLFTQPLQAPAPAAAVAPQNQDHHHFDLA